MRKLKKSYGESAIFIVRAKHRTNKSPKPFNRLMHSIHDRTHGFEPNPYKVLGLVHSSEPNRAARRAALFTPPACMAEGSTLPVPVLRKLTGAVRRDMVKGKQA